MGFLIGLVIGIILYFYVKGKLSDREKELIYYKTQTREFDRNKAREIEDLKKIWDAEKEKEIKERIEHTRKETGTRQRAVLKGKIGEQLAPLLVEFHSKYDLADARFIGQPIDYLIFKNLTKLKDEIQSKVPKDERSEIEIVLADIKTGGSQLNTEQRKIRNAVKDGRISWDEIRIDMPEEEEIFEEEEDSEIDWE